MIEAAESAIEEEEEDEWKVEMDKQFVSLHSMFFFFLYFSWR